MTNAEGYMKAYYEKNKESIKRKSRERAGGAYFCDICQKAMRFSTKTTHIRTARHKLNEELYLAKRLRE